MQQFVNQSPWDWVPVRRALAARMSGEIVPEAWVIDDAGFPKFGKHSVGVARQYSGSLGRVGNCQVAVSVNAASDEASCPLDWRLFIPKEWDEDSEFNVDRRKKAGLGDDLHHVEKWRLALEMIDEIAGWGLDPPVILADGAYGETTQFRQELEDRGISYVLDAKASTSACAQAVKPERPEYQGRGQPPKARYRQTPSSLLNLALQAGPDATEEVSWREGTRGEMTSRFLTLRVRPANVKLRNAASRTGGEIPLCWLICEWPQDKQQPVKYWLSNLPEDTPIEDLVRLAKMRWRIEHDYRELKDALGLDHFEGRGYRGWNHHVTLVSVAHAFLTIQRRRHDRRPRLRAAA